MKRIEGASENACRWTRPQGFVLLLIAAAACLAAQTAAAHWRASPLVTMDVVDRTDAAPLAVYFKDAQRYVVGTPGHEYTIRIRNNSGERILAVTSVDGVNVVTGETASPEQSGYVIDAGGSVEISGWRRSLERTVGVLFHRPWRRAMRHARDARRMSASSASLSFGSAAGPSSSSRCATRSPRTSGNDGDARRLAGGCRGSAASGSATAGRRPDAAGRFAPTASPVRSRRSSAPVSAATNVATCSGFDSSGRAPRRRRRSRSNMIGARTWWRWACCPATLCATHARSVPRRCGSCLSRAEARCRKFHRRCSGLHRMARWRRRGPAPHTAQRDACAPPRATNRTSP